MYWTYHVTGTQKIKSWGVIELSYWELQKLISQQKDS